MAPIRSKTPPLLRTSTKRSSGPANESSSTPQHHNGIDGSFSMIGRSEHTIVPPSPSVPTPGLEAAGPASPTNDLMRALHAHTGAGIQKHSAKKSTRASTVADKGTMDAGKVRHRGNPKIFPFLELPGEVRNEIYALMGTDKQVLLVHRPRLASLRSRTRIDRARTLASDVADKEHDQTLSNVIVGPVSKKAKTENVPRDTNRPFWGFTQVCRQLRHEYRPIYMGQQEIGVDLTNVAGYMKAFYPSAPAEIAKLTSSAKRRSDMPFIGNLTIAIGQMLTKQERSSEGIEVFPLLDIWANSIKMEAGFGRYLKGQYSPETDQEAKDLYRLFGRFVKSDRSCSDMNQRWRGILRNQALASVRIHRSPPTHRVPSNTSTVRPTFRHTLGPLAAANGNLFNTEAATRPYIHLIFKKEKAEPWMTAWDSVIPLAPDWLRAHGFDSMEHFEIRVGVEQNPAH